MLLALKKMSNKTPTPGQSPADNGQGNHGHPDFVSTDMYSEHNG